MTDTTARTGTPATSTDLALHEKVEHAEVLPESENVLLPTKNVPTPQRRPRETRLRLTVNSDAVEDEADVLPLPPLLMTETTADSGHRGGLTAPQPSRRLSVTCIAVEGPSPEPSRLRKTSGRLCMSRVAALRPPNDASVPGAAVRDGLSFVLNRCTPVDRATPVELHTYDLSHGYLKQCGKELVGIETPGVYHSAIVCYGMEVYFEGGIGVAAAGRTHFGDKYRTHRLGVTTKSATEFFRWIAVRALQVNQIHDYHPVRHNCHHFTGEAAHFLLGDAGAIPRYLFTTVGELVRSEVGGAVAEILTITTHGIQSAVARQMRSRTVERQCSVDMQLSASTACGVMALPPTAAVLFRAGDVHLAKRLLQGLTPYVAALEKQKRMKPAALTVLAEMVHAVTDGTDSIAPTLMLNYVQMVSESLLSSSMAMWGPIFNGLRVAVLHKLCLLQCAFDRRLMSILMLAARDFPRLLPDGRVAFLRVLCNFACSAHGAIVYSDYRYRDSCVAVVGLGLMDSSSTVVYTAACLALNLSIGIVTTCSPTLKRDMAQFTDEHHALRLATLLLYNLRRRSAEALPEPSFNMLLLALYRLASSNGTALDYVVTHPFKPRYSELLDRSASNESRALVCLLKTLEDLYS